MTSRKNRREMPSVSTPRDASRSSARRAYILQHQLWSPAARAATQSYPPTNYPSARMLPGGSTIDLQSELGEYQTGPGYLSNTEESINAGARPVGMDGRGPYETSTTQGGENVCITRTMASNDAGAPIYPEDYQPTSQTRAYYLSWIRHEWKGGMA